MNRTGAGIYAVRALYLVQTITPPHIFSRRSHTWRSVCSTWAHTRSHSIPADGDRNYGGPATSQWCSSRSVRSPVLGRHAPTAPCLLLKSCRRPADSHWRFPRSVCSCVLGRHGPTGGCTLCLLLRSCRRPGIRTGVSRAAFAALSSIAAPTPVAAPPDPISMRLNRYLQPRRGELLLRLTCRTCTSAPANDRDLPPPQRTR
ncbi:hypothetical protein DFH06DRAFT_618081 [Mycena polygramma]|nr:hypothetical protein DFH06DRAFT_618081 [Mycena polygramma]